MVKQRNIALCIIFTIITCGIYGIYWFICLSNDANTVSQTAGTSGGMAFLLTMVTCGMDCFILQPVSGFRVHFI